MTDQNSSDPSGDDIHKIAQRSPDACITDEGAAYAKAVDVNTADDETADGKWKSTNDGSGTSETD
jgi:hypothetical protein